MAGYDIRWASNDVRRDHPGDPKTGYEQRLTAQGAQVHGICAVANPKHIPSTDEIALAEKAVSQSLVDYLPDDLNTMDYIPHGMEATVINLRNLKAKQHH